MAKNPSSPDLDEPKTFLSREKPPRTPELRHRIDQAPKLTDGDHRRKTHGDLSVSAERARPSRRCAVHLFLKGSAVRAESAQRMGRHVCVLGLRMSWDSRKKE